MTYVRPDPNANTQRDPGVVKGGGAHLRHVRGDGVRRVDVLHGRLGRPDLHAVRVRRARKDRLLGPGRERRLLPAAPGTAHAQAHGEAVELRTGKRVRAPALDRVWVPTTQTGASSACVVPTSDTRGSSIGSRGLE